MQNPWFIEQKLAVSGSVWSPGTIPLVKARTLSVTCRCTFGGSIDADTTVYIYYSPDGSNWDTIAYTSFVIAFTISTTKQRTVPISVPEHGFIKIKVTNGSSADTVTAVSVWYSIQSYENKFILQTGNILGDTGEEGSLVSPAFSATVDKP